MLRWRWVLLLWAIGGLMTAYGVWVEIEVRRSVGSGLRRFMANLLYQTDITQYRWVSMLCAVLGPLVIVGAFLLRRNWGPARESQWLQQQSGKLVDKARWWQAQSSRLAKTDPVAAAAARRKAQRYQRKSQRLGQQAQRKLGSSGQS